MQDVDHIIVKMVNGRGLKMFANSSSSAYINVMHNMDF
ncbi:hypothetical protein T4C_12556 [Trichinella pseudospiralis]|uniref:Uncharacterized protein n=1 Tax=Trichinella pseudospiralis TaxID=6337 RepID=A0A0V1G972_TRIPS|nr:hypothetical protein T4C_10687 [Trichinella pseudospiralis]KRY94684.1 hypothetical protein T4C_12556 [Trichinella pseudospiralis]